MVKFRNYLVFNTFLFFTSEVATHKILALFPHIAKSHFIMGEALMKGLAARGHQVFVVSHFPQEHSVKNYNDISLVGSMRNAVEDTPLENVGNGDVLMSVDMLANLAVETCEKVLSFPPVQGLINSKENFDLIIVELFNTDCMLGFVHKFQVPFVAIGTSVMMPWGNARFGNPDNPSYIPHHFLAHSDRMTFSERVVNTVFQTSVQWAYHSLMDMPTQSIARRYFGDSLPPLADIARNTSLLLLNTHFSMNRPRPLVPQIVEVGGLHLPLPRPLPEDIKKFLDDSEHGVIYFSLGSIVKTETLAADKREAFLQAFAELPQRILWKWEADTIPNKPPNVKIAKWLPQADVLRHRNVKVFLTHGGLMGTIEAVHNGVPMVGIPLFGDQEVNIRTYVSEGFAIKLHFNNITKENVLQALRTVLHDTRYRENAVRVSKAFNDRPMSPLDTAIYWTEYVIRHAGAPHLRSAAVELTCNLFYRIKANHTQHIPSNFKAVVLVEIKTKQMKKVLSLLMVSLSLSYSPSLEKTYPENVHGEYSYEFGMHGIYALIHLVRLSSALWLIVNLSLLYGTINEDADLIAPWIAWHLVQIFLQVIIAAWCGDILTGIVDAHAVDLAGLIITVIISEAVLIYFIIVVNSYHQTLKKRSKEYTRV